MQGISYGGHRVAETQARDRGNPEVGDGVGRVTGASPRPEG